MTTTGTFYPSGSKVYDDRMHLPTRDFLGKLQKTAVEKCKTIVGISENEANSLECKYEMMAGLSCVLLNKANVQYGDWRSNVFMCRHELDIVKANLSKMKVFEQEKLDDYLTELGQANKNFC